MNPGRASLLLAALAVSAAGLGCATLPACPSKGGPAWTEHTSAHFVVRTDLRNDDAADLKDRAGDVDAGWRAASSACPALQRAP